MPQTIPQNFSDPNEASDYLKSLGVDTSILTSEQINSLGAMALAFKAAAGSYDVALPKTFTPDELGKFFDQASKEIDPYYQEQLKVGTKDIQDTLAQMTGDVAWLSKSLATAQEQERLKLANQIGSAGMAWSDQRRKEQANLTTQQGALVRSERSKIKSNLDSLNKTYEQTYGSAALVALKAPQMQFIGQSVAPAAPYGGLMGTQPKEERVATLGEQNILATNAVKSANVGLPNQ